MTDTDYQEPTPTPAMTRQVAAAYFASWAAADEAAFRVLLADDVTWQGPTWRAANAEECMAAFRVAVGHVSRIDVKRVWVDGEEALTWLDVYAAEGPPRPIANWMTVRDGLVVSVRASGDLVKPSESHPPA